MFHRDRNYISQIARNRAEAMTKKSFDDLPDAAKRALAEAEERRRKAVELSPQKELGGRDGPEPVRFGDWERKGIAVDF